MTSGIRAVMGILKRDWAILLPLGGAIFVTYHISLLAVPAIRFRTVPNYFAFYDPVESVRLVLAGTPSLIDALGILAEEPLFETGYMHPDFGIAEWSLMIIPHRVTLALLLSGLLASFLLVRREAARRGGGGTLSPAAAATGASCLALGSASLTWVVCCATPSWAAMLAILGVSTTVALALGPFEALVAGGGGVLLLLAMITEARRASVEREETPR